MKILLVLLALTSASGCVALREARCGDSNVCR